MVEDELKTKFEAFTSKFEESIFTLISKFAEINENMSRVQEGLDFLGKLRIQTAENKQLMTKVEKAFKNLERKLREMSADGFIISDESVEEEREEDIDDFLSATVDTQETEVEDNDLSEFGNADELPSVDDILSSKELDTIEKPLVPKAKESNVPSEPLEKVKIKNLPNAPKQPPEILEVEKEKEIIIGLDEPPIHPKEIPNQINDDIFPEQVNNQELTPTPKLEPSGLSPTPKAPPNANIGLNEGNLTPVPKPPSEVPKENLSEKSTEVSGTQKIINLMGPKDVWYNLTIDIKNAQNNEQIALALGRANDGMKNFVRFHKVLFELLKTASSFRKSNPEKTPSQNEKGALFDKISEWRLELK